MKMGFNLIVAIVKRSEYKQERNRIEDKVKTLVTCKKEKVKVGVKQKKY